VTDHLLSRRWRCAVRPQSAAADDPGEPGREEDRAERRESGAPMKRLMALVGTAVLVTAACGAGASPTPTPAPATPTAVPTATPAPSVAPSPASVTVHVTFDGEKCSYAGPAVVQEGTTIVWAFENTPAAIQASNEKGAKSLGSELVIIPVAEGTTWETFLADSPPEGTKGDWPPAPAYLLVDSTQVGYGSASTVITTAAGDGYVVMCNLYWDYDTGTPFAVYKGALVQVLKG
jgi:hypothetical protein